MKCAVPEVPNRLKFVEKPPGGRDCAAMIGVSDFRHFGESTMRNMTSLRHLEYPEHYLDATANGRSEVSVAINPLLALQLTLLVMSVFAVVLTAAPPTLHSRMMRRIGVNSAHSRERFLAFPQLPYPYHQRPSYRYPYYDNKGQGRLVYGYGGRQLFRYSDFQPLEGYSKKR